MCLVTRLMCAQGGGGTRRFAEGGDRGEASEVVSRVSVVERLRRDLYEHAGGEVDGKVEKGGASVRILSGVARSEDEVGGGEAVDGDERMAAAEDVEGDVVSRDRRCRNEGRDAVRSTVVELEVDAGDFSELRGEVFRGCVGHDEDVETVFGVGRESYLEDS